MSKASFIAAILQSAASISTAMGGAPAGVVLPYAGSASPNGWLLCHGQAINRTAYPELFAAIGATYGAGDGATTFNLPDMRGRVAGGRDDMGGAAAGRLTVGISGATLGSVGGSQQHQLAATEMPSHNHTFTGNEMAPHSHSYKGAKYLHPGQTGGASAQVAETLTTDAVSAGTPTGTIGDTGGGAAHNNIQPTIVLNYIIRAA